MPHTTDFDALCQTIQQFADCRYPGHCGGEFRVRLADGSSLVVPVIRAAAVLPGLAPATSAVAIAETPENSTPAVEQAILNTLARCDPDDPPTGDQLAHMSDYSFNGRFREALSKLIREGRIVNRRPGYSLPA